MAFAFLSHPISNASTNISSCLQNVIPIQPLLTDPLHHYLSPKHQSFAWPLALLSDWTPCFHPGLQASAYDHIHCVQHNFRDTLHIDFNVRTPLESCNAMTLLAFFQSILHETECSNLSQSLLLLCSELQDFLHAYSRMWIFIRCHRI